jgi:hypothetical protein
MITKHCIKHAQAAVSSNPVGRACSCAGPGLQLIETGHGVSGDYESTKPTRNHFSSPRAAARLRSATTTMEIVIGIVLLGSAVSLLGQFAASVKKGLADQELSARLGWEISNVCETIRCWDPSQITAARIQAIPLSDSIRERLPDAVWKANVSAITDPASAWQVELQLACNYQGQSAVPVQLTFWIEREAVHD